MNHQASYCLNFGISLSGITIKWTPKITTQVSNVCIKKHLTKRFWYLYI